MSADWFARQAAHVHEGQCGSCGALPGHQRPAAAAAASAEAHDLHAGPTITRTSDRQTFHFAIVESPMEVDSQPRHETNEVIFTVVQDVRFVLVCDGCGGLTAPSGIAEHRCG